MDYIDYELNKYYKMQDEAEDMERLGIDDYEEYLEYLADAKACAEIANYEALEER